MRWWIELVVSTIAYWICVAVLVALVSVLLGDCAAGTTDAEAASCLREGHVTVWTVITVSLVAYVGIVAWWVSKRNKSEGN